MHRARTAPPAAIPLPDDVDLRLVEATGSEREPFEALLADANARAACAVVGQDLAPGPGASPFSAIAKWWLTRQFAVRDWDARRATLAEPSAPR